MFIGVNIELFDNAQTRDVGSLLYFPGPPLLPVKTRFTAEIWQRGSITAKKVKSSEDFVEIVKATHCSQAWLRMKAPSVAVANLGVKLKAVETELRVSPTCDLWDSPSTWSREERLKQLKRFYAAQTAEYIPKADQITQWPTRITAHFEMEGDMDRNEFGSRFTSVLAESIPDKLIRFGVFGAAIYSIDGDQHAGGPGGILDALIDWRKGVPMLGPLFADLFTYLIGPLDACTGLAEAIGRDRVQLAARYASGGSYALGVLYIPDALRFDPEVRAVSSHWMVPRDASTATYRFGSEMGEYYLGNSYYTQRRYEQLRAEDRIAPADPYVFAPVVDPKHSVLLGIDPMDMLVERTYTEHHVEEIHEIDVYLSGLTDISNEADRLWRAYYHVWMNRSPSIAPDFVEFMRRTYFPETAA